APRTDEDATQAVVEPVARDARQAGARRPFRRVAARARGASPPRGTHSRGGGTAQGGDEGGAFAHARPAEPQRPQGRADPSVAVTLTNAREQKALGRASKRWGRGVGVRRRAAGG